MDLKEIKKVPLSRKRPTRIGRGVGSGKGGTSTKGHKGQNCRSGVTLPVVFEGGTMPLYRRIPKRGFNNKRFQKTWVTINVHQLNRFSDGQEVSLEKLKELNVVKFAHGPICLKILGNGELKTTGLNVKAHKISGSAKQKIEEQKGKCELLPLTSEKRGKQSRRKS